MPTPLPIALIGQGRIGFLHALHVQEVANETGSCVLSAVVDINFTRAQESAGKLSKTQATPITPYPSITAMLAAGAAEASFIASSTDAHRPNATQLIQAGHRVLLEKPLTGTLEGDREFARELNTKHPTALMLAFQRRFDPPLQHARRLVQDGAIGRVFKIVSILEDSNPAPNGYVSGGILPDMSVHNVDEVLWLTGQAPSAAAAIGNCIHSKKYTTATEDFDDAFLHLWFPGELTAQITVTRNHVSGYRVETWIFGDKGQIHIGRFEMNRHEVMVEAYGRTGPIERKAYAMRDYGAGLPEFVDRFGAAYKAEFVDFVQCVSNNRPFSVNHEDGLRAMEVIAMGSQRWINPS